MFKKIIFSVLLFSAITYNNISIAQVCEYEVENACSHPDLDGNKLTDGWIWGIANPTPLEYYADKANEWDWKNPWPGLHNDSLDIWVVWEAVWKDTNIYIFVTMEDDILDDDQVSTPNFFEDEDSIHLLFKRDKNVSPPPAWDWATDRNYLMHNAISDSFYIRNAAGEFTGFATPQPLYAFGYQNADPKWFTESSIRSSSGKNYVADVDYVWYNIIYNDADATGIPIERTRRLTWCAETDNPPWGNSNLVKLLLKSSDPCAEAVKFKTLCDDNSDAKIDGFLTEKAYYSTYPVILTSTREPATFLDDSLWTPWSTFSDAAIIWRAFWNSNSSNLYIGFEIHDNFKVSNNFTDSLQTNLIKDDGLHLWIDFNDNQMHNDITNLNILIHNMDSIYQYTGEGENFDAPYIRPIDVQAKTRSIDNTSNWIAEVKVHFPQNFKLGPDSTLRIEIGYNDADRTLVRDHQLVWSNVTAGIQPWNNFTKLGKFKLTKSKKCIGLPDSKLKSKSNNFMLFPNYPNPFNAQTTIAFSIKKQSHVTIKVYDLLGRLVTTLVDQPYTSGSHQVRWNGTNTYQETVSSGLYFVKMSVGDYIKTHKMILMK